MTFRARLIVAATAITLLTLGAAFAAVARVVNNSQEAQLDAALLAEALEEATEVASLGGDELAISARPGPLANDVGPLTKYGTIYGPNGELKAATPTFGNTPPNFSSVRHAYTHPFDWWHGREHLRGVLVRVPSHPGVSLLLAAPRADLDGDAAFLSRAMLIVFVVAVLWSVIVATSLVRRLTREHQAVTDVARRVAGGDLRARVASRSGGAEVAQLTHDIDEMVARLELLVSSQQQFIAHAAHELRSPLTSLYGELSLALRRERTADEYRTFIEESLSSTQQLKTLVDDLLQLARIGSFAALTMEPVSLKSVVNTAAESQKRQALEREVSIEQEVADVHVLGHTSDLVRMLGNLIANAIRYSPRAGKIVVHVSANNKDVRIEVRDQGAGIDPEDRDSVFEPFYRGARDRASSDGTGLGLAIVRSIARAHNGEVHVEAGDSTRFVVTLPKDF